MNVSILAIVLLVTTVLEAVEGLISLRKYNAKVITQTQRIKIYKSTILWEWVQALICFLLFTLLFPIKEIGLMAPMVISGNIHYVFGILVYIISIGLFLLLTYQIFMFKFSTNYRVELAKVMEKKSGMQGVDIMIPTTRLEKKWFRFCALTAAICEEIIFRGLLFYIIKQYLPEANSYLVLVIGSVIFGIAHMYQGLSGMVRTALTGALIGALFLVSGSLIYGVILHFVIDISANYLYEEKEC